MIFNFTDKCLLINKSNQQKFILAHHALRYSVHPTLTILHCFGAQRKVEESDGRRASQKIAAYLVLTRKQKAKDRKGEQPASLKKHSLHDLLPLGGSTSQSFHNFLADFHYQEIEPRTEPLVHILNSNHDISLGLSTVTESFFDSV